MGRQPIAYMDDALPSGYSTLDYAGCKVEFFEISVHGKALNIISDIFLQGPHYGWSS